jgi:hypothetical protein
MQEDDVNVEFERALKSLRPTGVKVDDVSAAYAAGRRTGRRGVWAWRGVAGVLLVVGLGGWIRNAGAGREPAETRTTTYVKREAGPVSEQSVVRLQRAVEKDGVAGLPVTELTAARGLRVEGM